MKYLRQSTAATIPVGPFVDKTDGVTAKTALTDQSAKARLIKNGTGAAFTADSWNHDADGTYLVGLTTTHTNTLGRLRLSFVDAATYLPAWEDFMVLPAAVYDSLVAGSDTLSADATQWNGGALPTIPSASANGAAAATAILAAPANKLQTDASGNALAVTGAGAAIAPASAIVGASDIGDIVEARTSEGFGDVLAAVALCAKPGDAMGNVNNVLGDVNGDVHGDLRGKVLGGGVTAITGTGARVELAVPTGTRAVALRVVDGDGAAAPLAVVAIYESTNTTQLWTVTASLAGRVTVNLNDATYQLRVVCPGYTFAAATELVVAADATVTVTGSKVAVTPPDDPGDCRIYDWLKAAGGPSVGAKVQIVIDVPSAVGTCAGANDVYETTTDEDGYFQLDVPRNAHVKVRVPRSGLDWVKRVVPNAATQQLGSWTA